MNTFKRTTAQLKMGLQASLLTTTILVVPHIASAQEGVRPANSVLMDEIVVTARKREEGVQSVPIAITAFSNESIDARGLTRIDQLAAFTPNLTFRNNPGFSGATNVAEIYIRGVGQFDFLGSIDPGVGLYIDGVYLSRSVGAMLDLVDIERIEILRGPQGTLFGRNTIGGAVNITTQKPSEDFEGRVRAIYGADDRLEFTGSVSLPITEEFRTRISGAYLSQDGYVEDVNTGERYGDRETFVLRAQAVWEPTDNFSAQLIFDYTDDQSNGPASVLAFSDTDSNVFNPNRLPLLPPGPPLSPFTLAGGGTAAGAGFQGVVDPSVAGLLPPGVDPNTQFYQLNVAAARPPFGSPPGTPADSAFGGPLDAPVDNFTALLNYLASYGPGGTPGLCVSAPFQPYFSESDNPACFSARFNEENLGDDRVALDSDQFSDSVIWGGSLRLDWDTGPVQLVSITGYREIDMHAARDQDASPFLISVAEDFFDQWQLSQELQVKGTKFDGRLEWIAGGYYFREAIVNDNPVSFPAVSVRSGGNTDNESLAFFAQANYDVTASLKFTAGLRWTKEDKTFDSAQVQFVSQSNIGPGIAYGFDACTGATTLSECTPADDTDGLPFTGPLTIFENRISELSFERLNPYINLSYTVRPDLLVYASYSQGFKSGGFTQRVFPPLPESPTVGPEETEVYEVGMKSTWFDGALRLNASVFHTKYTDLQILGFTPETGVAPVYFNAGRARIRGVEVDFAATPFENLFIEGGVGYLDPQYLELDQGVQDASQIFLDNQFERVSEWTASLGAQYEIDLGSNAGTLRPRVDWSYRSGHFFDARNSPEAFQEGYGIVNTTVTYLDPEGRYEAQFGLENALDKDFFISLSINGGFSNVNGIPTRGRQWYMRLTANF